MRRDVTDQAEAMARQRVQDLGEELLSAGLLPAEDDDGLPVVLVRSPGRHAQAGPGRSLLGTLGVRVGERLPFSAAHLTVLVAIAAVVLIGVAWVRISGASQAVPVPRARTAPATTSTSASPAAGVVVDVAGKVRRPGVLTLPGGSRVIDAIRRAGGVRHRSDLTGLNLARVLVDGEQILVGGVAPAASGSGSPAPGTAASATVSLNQASLEQLESLPGVGPVTAQKILDYRTAHGPFGAIDELLDVDGIGQKTLAQLAPHLVL